MLDNDASRDPVYSRRTLVGSHNRLLYEDRSKVTHVGLEASSGERVVCRALIGRRYVTSPAARHGRNRSRASCQAHLDS